MNTQQLASRIQFLRKQRALTQATLAEHLGVSAKAVSKWERGLSCPDVSLLGELSRLLGVSVDALLGVENTTAPHEGAPFLSLEKYLLGEFGFLTGEYHPEREDITFLFDCPDTDEALHGTAAMGERINLIFAELLCGDASFSAREGLKERIGITYCSDVPLFVMRDELSPLVGELEYVRLNAHYFHPLIRERFFKKMDAILTNESIKIIALTRWWNQKYLGAYLGQISPRRLARLQERIIGGTLRILFVGQPSLWAKPALEGRSNRYELSTLIEYLKQNP